MKVAIVLFALLSVGLCTDPPKCPPPSEFVDLFPNPDDCATFYICDDHQVPVLTKCPDGLWFNPELSVCDYPPNIPEGVCKPPAIF